MIVRQKFEVLVCGSGRSRVRQQPCVACLLRCACGAGVCNTADARCMHAGLLYKSTLTSVVLTAGAQAPAAHVPAPTHDVLPVLRIGPWGGHSARAQGRPHSGGGKLPQQHASCAPVLQQLAPLSFTTASRAAILAYTNPAVCIPLRPYQMH